MKKGTIYTSERLLIILTLRRHDWNRTTASEELGISLRGLRYKLARYKKEGFDIKLNPTNAKKHTIRQKLKTPIVRRKKRVYGQERTTRNYKAV